MRYCIKCLQPITRPGIIFKEGVCGACISYAERDKIDWNARNKELNDILTEVKSRKHPMFDCVIGVSGGRDSLYQSFRAYLWGLRALLVNAVPADINEVGRKNLDNLVKQTGFPLITLHPPPEITRAAVKKGFYENLNPVKYPEHALWTSSYIIAAKFRIPLVIQGENPAITLGVSANMPADGNALNIRKHDTLSGEIDHPFYKFPGDDELEGIHAIFLNYYDREWGWSSNTEFGIMHGLSRYPDHSPVKRGRLSPYVSVDSDLQVVNQMLKYYKFGFGFVTDEVCYAIREGRMTRREGIKLIERYDGKCDHEYIMSFCDYIGIDIVEFWRVVEKFVNPELFEHVKGEWRPRFRVGGL